MTDSLLSDLLWLPRPQANFNEQCRLLMASPTDVGRSVRTLSSYGLDQNQLIRLAKVVAKAQRERLPLAPLTPFRLGLVGNGTLDFIVPALVASAARYGIALECVKADYGQVVQEAQAPQSIVNRALPDAVLVAVDYRGLPLSFTPSDAVSSCSSIEDALSYLAAVRAGIRSNSGAVCILQTLAPPPEQLFGSIDRMVTGAPRNVIETFNRELATSIAGSQDVLSDVAMLAETVGLAQWHSPFQWNLAKLPFCDSYLPLYADHVARIIGALRGKSRRCLVLDLDNTLWGGVIGDDGLEGIHLAQGDATGEAYLAVQRFALSLRERGVILAVSSKNNDEVARSPFRSHPEMLLREEHLAVFQANWNDKATNIRAISDELALGLESFVLLDDNPAERELIRQRLPEVAVPELPADPALYVRTLAAAGYFEAITFSDEDRQRADFYQENARRLTLQKQAGDLQEYLKSLDMKITFRPFDAVGRVRIVQLINKSNQFNLTTRRYSEADVSAIEQDPKVFTLQVRLADKFGDNGMISVVICREDAQSWQIDTWLMSCRVLGRHVETMVLREILDHARRRGIRKLVGAFRPSERNKLVEDHYAKLGFTQVAAEADGITIWELSTDCDVPLAPMVVERVGFDLVPA